MINKIMKVFLKKIESIEYSSVTATTGTIWGNTTDKVIW